MWSRWFWAIVFIGGWTAFALLFAVEVYLAQLHWGKPVTWELAFRRTFKEVYSYALCSLVVLWVCNRLPLVPMGRGRWIALHMIGAFIFSLTHVAMVSWLQAGEISVQTGQVLTFSYLFENFVFSKTTSNMFKYWIFVLFHLGWQYSQRYRERERAAATLSTELVQARLQALRMQINPHFLFNTLNTISALIRMNPDAADRMIVRLSELLRRTLDRGDVQEVPLSEEIEFLKSYLEIEQMRFSDRLTVTFDIEPKANELLVPHLILQPLVENALRHGILPREESGRIKISARLVEGQHLELSVRDDGNGLSPANGKPEREGIGIKNVRSRLAQLYRGAEKFAVENASGGGVEARICIPSCTIPRSQAPRVVGLSASEGGKADPPLPREVSVQPEMF